MVRKEDDNDPEAEQPPPHEAHEQGQANQHQQNPLERFVSGMSALLLLAAIGYLVWEGLSSHDPPSFEVEVEQVREIDSRYHLWLAIKNTGDESVQALSLEARLQQGDSTVATVTSDLSWLPAKSTRKAVVIFTKDPRQYELIIEPKGYELP